MSLVPHFDEFLKLELRCPDFIRVCVTVAAFSVETSRFKHAPCGDAFVRQLWDR